MSMPFVSVIRFDTAFECCTLGDLYICCFDVRGNSGIGQNDYPVNYAHGSHKTSCNHHLLCRTSACMYIGIAIDSNKRTI